VTRMSSALLNRLTLVSPNGSSVVTITKRVVLYVGFVLASALLQSNVLRALFAFSQDNASASHVILIPLVSVALVFQRRSEILTAASTAWRGGLGTILAGVCLSVVTSSSLALRGPQDALALRVLALVVIWVGGFLLIFGWRAFRAARFPLAFLAFTIPMPGILLDGVTELLKRGSTEVVAALLALTPIPFHREGFVFSMPTLSIEVADACSGIRSSIALVLTALLTGHMFLESGWKKALLVLAILPISLLKNGVRIVSLSLLATYVDPAFLVGRLHHDGGIVFFLLALAMLLPVLTILRRSEAVADFKERQPSPSA
jgi:exosortase